MLHLMRMARGLSCAALLALSLGHPAGAQALFRVGTPDRSAREFALAPGGYQEYATRFPGDVTVTLPAGAATAWPYIQPGPADAWAGARVHPFTIRYTAPADRSRDLLLVLRYADVQEITPPVVEVSSNGAMLEKSRLRPGGGGGAYGSGAMAPASLGIRIPATTLKEGENTLTIRNIEGSWTVWDAVELLPMAEGGPKVAIESVEPTVLFVRDPKDGAERQLVDVWAVNTGAPGPVTLRAAVGAKAVSTTREVPSGVTVQRIAVPPASGPGAKLSLILEPGGATRTVPLPVERRWEIHIVHGSHLDIGYTDLQPRVQALQNELIDRAVAACEATAGYPDAAKFRWNIQSGWVLDNYLKERPAREVRRLAACVRAGQISVSGSYVNNLYDLTSAEQLIRQVYPNRRFEAATGAPIRSAFQIDVTGVTWQYVQALARSGVKYLVMGNNADHAPQPWPGPTVFWWQAPDGSRLLTWNGGPEGHYSEGYWTMNGAADADALAGRLAARLRRVAAGGYPHSAYLLLTMADNAPLATDLPDMVRRFNETYTSPRLVFSTPERFFAAVERGKGKVPTVRGDWSDWWVDGAASSARETAVVRAAQDRTVSAEILGSLAAMCGAKGTPALSLLDEAYRQANLYTEHTWGAAALRWDDPQWPYKREFAERAESASWEAHKASVTALNGRIRNTDGRPAIAVFNSLAWPRTDTVQIAIPTGALGGRGYRLMDGTKPVPHEVVQRGKDGEIVRFVARNVPALGYRTFALRPAEPSAPSATDLRVTAASLENAYYRVRLDPKTGAIRSLYDKARNREMVDAASRYGLNQFVYRPNPEGRALHPTTGAREWSPVKANIRILSRGPVRATFEVTADPGAGGDVTGIRSLVQRISLTAGVPRVDIEDVVDKARVETGEEGYFAFPFRAARPRITYEIPGAFARFVTDQVPGSAMDFQAVWRSVDVSASDGGVLFSTPDAPLVEFDRIRTYEHDPRPGRLGAALDPAAKYMPVTGHVFSHVFDNLWGTNYRIAQEGIVTFRYAIASHPAGFDAVRSTRFGAGVHTPMDARILAPGQSGPLPPGARSLATVDSPHVVVQTIKAASGRPGYAVRLREVAGKAATVVLRLPAPVRSATLADPTERPIRTLSVRSGRVLVPVRPHEMATVLVRLVPR